MSSEVKTGVKQKTVEACPQKGLQIFCALGIIPSKSERVQRAYELTDSWARHSAESLGVRELQAAQR